MFDRKRTTLCQTCDAFNNWVPGASTFAFETILHNLAQRILWYGRTIQRCSGFVPGQRLGVPLIGFSGRLRLAGWKARTQFKD